MGSPVVKSVQEAADQQYSYIICAVKCLTDVHTTSEILAPLLAKLASSPTTSIVLLQNGIGIEDDVLETLSGMNLRNPVISGCAWVDVTPVDGGRTVTQHGNERLVLGYHRSPNASECSESASRASLDQLCMLLRAGGSAVELAEIDVARWRKVLWYV